MKEIKLTKGFMALVDDEDFEKLNSYKWTSAIYGIYVYARRTEERNGKRRNIKMHREVVKATDPTLDVDHINHNTLDNRKSNLRICTRSQNMKNRKVRVASTSGFLGVWWVARRSRWKSCIMVKEVGKQIFLGYFKSEIEAALAYNEAAKKYHGDFAQLNELDAA